MTRVENLVYENTSHHPYKGLKYMHVEKYKIKDEISLLLWSGLSFTKDKSKQDKG